MKCKRFFFSFCAPHLKKSWIYSWKIEIFITVAEKNTYIALLAIVSFILSSTIKKKTKKKPDDIDNISCKNVYSMNFSPMGKEAHLGLRNFPFSLLICCLNLLQ